MKDQCLFCRETNAEIYRRRMEIRRIEREIENLKDEKKMCVCGDRTQYFKERYRLKKEREEQI